MKNLLLSAAVLLIATASFSQVRVDGTTGWTSVGTSDFPTETLDVRGNALFGNATIGKLSIDTESNADNTKIAHSEWGFLDIVSGKALRLVANTKTRLQIQKNGDMLLKTGEAYKNGTGSWAILSDARLKTNVQNFSDGLDEIMKINTVTFNYNEKSTADTDKNYVGIIAQEVEKVAPYMVNDIELTDASEKNRSLGTYKSVNPDAFTYMLINAVQEQQFQMQEQQKQIESLNAKIEKLTGSNYVPNAISIAVNLEGNNGQALLGQNSPNPFANNTKIEYFVPAKASDAQVVFTDISGNQIKTINVKPGLGNLDVNVEGLVHGIYSYTLIVDGVAQATKKMIVE